MVRLQSEASTSIDAMENIDQMVWYTMLKFIACFHVSIIHILIHISLNCWMFQISHSKQQQHSFRLDGTYFIRVPSWCSVCVSCFFFITKSHSLHFIIASDDVFFFCAFSFAFCAHDFQKKKKPTKHSKEDNLKYRSDHITSHHITWIFRITLDTHTPYGLILSWPLFPATTLIFATRKPKNSKNWLRAKEMYNYRK